MTEKADSLYVQEEARINKIPVRQVPDLPAEVRYPIHKLLLTGDPVDMPHVEELMQQEFAGRLSIYRSQPFFIETMPSACGEGGIAGTAAAQQGADGGQPDGLRRWLERPAHDSLCRAGGGYGQRPGAGESGRRLLTADNDHDGVVWRWNSIF